MKSAVLLFLAVLFLATSVARGACVAVPSNKIRAQDLAAAVPAFQALDPEAFLARHARPMRRPAAVPATAIPKRAGHAPTPSSQ